MRRAKGPHSLHADLIYHYMLEPHGPQRRQDAGALWSRLFVALRSIDEGSDHGLRSAMGWGGEGNAGF
jgi:hypothetical protein